MAIPYFHFGGNGPLVHVGHANSFPPGMYQKMVEPLLKDFTVIGMESRPMWDPSMAGIKSWEDMAADLIQFLDENKWSKVHVVGHSLGAAKIIFASLQRPELFDKVVLVEPPFLPNWIFNVTKFVPMKWRKKLAPPSRVANNRKDQWPSLQEFYDYMRPKKVFAKISDEVLWDYVKHVHHEVQEGVALRYSKEWESHIYAALTSPWKALGKMNHKSLAIRGAETDIIVHKSWEKWQKTQSNTTFVNMEGAGHLIPFESPEKVGNQILQFLKNRN